MSNLIVFVQVHGRPGVLETALPPSSTAGDLHDALASAGITLDAEHCIFIDEAEEIIGADRHAPVPGLKHGCRIHVCRCRHIKTTVHYLEKTAEREFAPGARVRKVKEWAVHRFELNPKDAAEHVLQLCQSTDRPASDTPLHQLLAGHGERPQHDRGHAHHQHCELCFDLVPDKRVEG